MSKFDRRVPCNDLPLLPPNVDIETKSILRKTISAGRAFQEAKASSEVEKIITTNDDLYKSYVSDKNIENFSTKEVLSYKEALWLGLEELKSKPFITTNLCVKIVQCIK